MKTLQSTSTLEAEGKFLLRQGELTKYFLDLLREAAEPQTLRAAFFTGFPLHLPPFLGVLVLSLAP